MWTYNINPLFFNPLESHIETYIATFRDTMLVSVRQMCVEDNKYYVLQEHKDKTNVFATKKLAVTIPKAWIWA